MVSEVSKFTKTREQKVKRKTIFHEFIIAFLERVRFEKNNFCFVGEFSDVSKALKAV
jgi:hypothetical protein